MEQATCGAGNVRPAWHERYFSTARYGSAPFRVRQAKELRELFLSTSSLRRALALSWLEAMPSQKHRARGGSKRLGTLVAGGNARAKAQGRREEAKHREGLRRRVVCRRNLTAGNGWRTESDTKNAKTAQARKMQDESDGRREIQRGIRRHRDSGCRV